MEDGLDHYDKSVQQGRFYAHQILEIAARGRSPLIIRVVGVVPVEFWLVVIEIDIRHVVGVLVAGTFLSLLILVYYHRKKSFTDQMILYAQFFCILFRGS